MAVAIVLIILLLAVALFITEALPIDLVAVLMLLALALTRIITPTEALSGFSDPSVITITSFFYHLSRAFQYRRHRGHRAQAVSPLRCE